jgi:ABC-type transporter Mla MlaB component
VRIPLKAHLQRAFASKTGSSVQGVHMPTTFEEDDSTCTLRLDGEMDICDALDLKRQLLLAMDSRKPVRIDLAGVAGLDITSMQLLWAAATEAISQGNSIHFNDPVSEGAVSSFSQAGLDMLQGRQQ